MAAKLTLGPVLYNWPADTWRDFYLRIADEAPVEVVFLGEAVCSKRAPLFDAHLETVANRLEAAGKELVFSTLSEVSSTVDRRLVARVAASDGLMVEVNDISALWHLSGRPHTIGPYINTYNEMTLKLIAGYGATSVCLPPEMPGTAITALGQTARALGIELETQVYGRMPLALSARCYHARAHGRTKDSCQFVCEEDPDGMALSTLEDDPFLAINGIQTLSYQCLNLIGELDALQAAGVGRFRLSPQSGDMVAVTETFRAVLDGDLGAEDTTVKLRAAGFDAPFTNGFLHGLPGHEWRERI